MSTQSLVFIVFGKSRLQPTERPFLITAYDQTTTLLMPVLTNGTKIIINARLRTLSTDGGNALFSG